ncbi:lamin tail domain-containing protein [Nodularia harveyana UHCC-0300]|uniref:Lamin tail domain-containing protein n=1 Tax=Nodularia harveyana UHCC-0300 TaxID=2974287 RepID=A0ABU5UBY0_9CYAN|nr:lamin tail domain-containing protein [Nodularia harveyana]MEA5580888.1 lamin tail domain-containing protein [Nodularia harveyana UHCC-0300]
MSEIQIKPSHKNQPGKIVVNADEWTLSNNGFATAPDTATFVINIAKWFTNGRNTGKFYAYSTNFGLKESSLAQTMTNAGYIWIVGKGIKLDLQTLFTFDGIFLCGDLVNNELLIDYVKAGGNVYLGAGKGWGGAQAEAEDWRTFLNAFGFKFLGAYNGIGGNQTVNSSHPIFAGVKAILQNNGNSIVDLDATTQNNQIILTHANGKGLIGTFAGSEAQAETTTSDKSKSQPKPEPITSDKSKSQPKPERITSDKSKSQPKPEPITSDESKSQPKPETTISDESESEEVINEFVQAETTCIATGLVLISNIVYKAQVKRTQADEYIEISNKGTTNADLSGWKIIYGSNQKQFFTFPAETTLIAGESFRVYTNQVHPETGGFSVGSRTAIWKDTGDEGKLFDAEGNQVSTLAYGMSGIPGIKAELGVPKLVIEASPLGIKKQMAFPGKITFTEALKLAISNLLEDDNDIESPLGLIVNDPGAYNLPQDVDKAAVIEVLRSQLNQPTSKLLLHTSKIGYAPKNGETIKDNWIFQLDINDGSLHWAIIDRSGVKAPYNYRFS